MGDARTFTAVHGGLGWVDLRTASVFGGVPDSRVRIELVERTMRQQRPGPGRQGNMPKPFGLTRLPALPAPDVWQARAAATMHAVEPRSTATVRLDAGGLGPGDIAGLILFNRLHAWLGAEGSRDGLTLAQFDGRSGRTIRVPLKSRRVWLRAECDFVKREARFRYSTDGARYADIGVPWSMGDGPIGSQGIECSLFSCATSAHAESGHAEFDSFVMATDRLTRRDAPR